MGKLGMEGLITGSAWLSMTAAAVVGPFVALLIGFVGTDRFLRWQLAEKRGPRPESTEPRQMSAPVLTCRYAQPD
jgi:hypothetical protein